MERIMKWSYRHIAHRIAACAGIPPSMMMVAIDAARQRIPLAPLPTNEDMRMLCTFLRLPATRIDTEQLIRRVQTAILALSTTHPTHARGIRWMAMAVIFGIDPEYLPTPVPPVIVDTVRA